MVTTASTPILTPSVLATAGKFKSLIDFQERECGLIARRTEVRIMEVCIVVRKHPLLYGAPGVAKSMAVDALMLHLPELSKFKTQAYKASPPEQFIGPISIKGMANDQFVRIIAGKLADCEVGVVDEISRAPRAVLPALQGIMVEREFDSGMGVVPVPMQSLIGTANHILDDPELAAFFDRWTFKLIVRAPQSQAEFKQILRGALKRQEFGPPPIPDELIISHAELDEFQEAATHVRVGEEILDAAAEMWSNVTGRGIISSPRRYAHLIESVRGVTLLDGRDEVTLDDLVYAAQHSLWNVESEAADVYAEVTKFASEWVREKAQLLDDFANVLERLVQVQSLVAAGADTSEKTVLGGDDPSSERAKKSITEHSIVVAHQYKTLDGLIAKQIDAATGQDTSELEAAREQMRAGQAWISTRILAGLEL